MLISVAFFWDAYGSICHRIGEFVANLLLSFILLHFSVQICSTVNNIVIFSFPLLDATEEFFEYDAEEFLVFLTLLITEGRTPEYSVKGRTEGLHCPPAQSAMPPLHKHECSDKLPQVDNMHTKYIHDLQCIFPNFDRIFSLWYNRVVSSYFMRIDCYCFFGSTEIMSVETDTAEIHREYTKIFKIFNSNLNFDLNSITKEIQ